ncbi:C2H2-type zinc finger protein [Medicago truncatula]|uniref:C2H2-type zinc finger protein n=1 Tax=Medicago truncatula TaxID=3880 RepID=A0A072UVR6_MEDTR|nr:C2H2-type zinc finger protein [Medicago truncatula]
MYECDLCDKRFNAGNTLGGHKTSHFYLHLHGHDHAINKDDDDDDDQKQKHGCLVCNKLKASSNVDNEKIEKQVGDINVTLATKVKDNNSKKSLLCYPRLKTTRSGNAAKMKKRRKIMKVAKMGWNRVLMN